MATAPSPNDLTRQQLDELDALLQRMLSVPLPPDTPPTTERGARGEPVGGSPPGPGGSPREARAPARGGVESGPAPTEPPLPPSWRIDPPAPRPASGPGGNSGSSAREGSAPHLALADPPSSVSLKFESSAPAPSALAQTPPPAAPLKPVPRAAPPAPAPKAPPAPAVAAPAPLSKSGPTPVAPPPPKATAGLTPAPSAPTVPVLFLPLVAFNALFDYFCGMFGPPGLLLRSRFFKQVYGLVGLALLTYTAAHVAQTRMWITLPFLIPWPQ